MSTNNLDSTYPLTAVNYSARLSTANPPFSGFYFKNYDVINDNELQLKVSDLAYPGYYDAIITDIAGYIKLSDRGYLIDGFTITPANLS